MLQLKYKPESFEKAIELVPKRIKESKSNYFNFSYLLTGIYVKHLENWYKHFNKSIR